MAEISWQVWGTPLNFNGFHVLSSLLHWRRSTEVNQTLHDVWPSLGLIHCIYIFGGSFPLTEFCQVQNFCQPGAKKFTLHPSLVFSYIGIVIAWHSSSGSQPNFVAWCNARNGIVELSVLILTITARLRIRRPCSCWEWPIVFSTPISGRAAITWCFLATSSS